jgi:hypothetical protein
VHWAQRDLDQGRDHEFDAAQSPGKEGFGWQNGDQEGGAGAGARRLPRRHVKARAPSVARRARRVSSSLAILSRALYRVGHKQRAVLVALNSLHQVCGCGCGGGRGGGWFD